MKNLKTVSKDESWQFGTTDYASPHNVTIPTKLYRELQASESAMALIQKRITRYLAKTNQTNG